MRPLTASKIYMWPLSLTQKSLSILFTWTDNCCSSRQVYAHEQLEPILNGFSPNNTEVKTNREYTPMKDEWNQNKIKKKGQGMNITAVIHVGHLGRSSRREAL